jgi:hypothetical protein
MAPELEQSHSDWRYRKKWWEDLEHSDDETYDDPMPVYIGGNDFDNELY